DYCLTYKTGNCSDFHSLYSSLARSLGIPTRMVYGSLFQGENTPVPNKASLDGKDVDGSYHCWIQFYAGGAGWVPLDVALANLLPTREQQEWYFGNLDARRVYVEPRARRRREDRPPAAPDHEGDRAGGDHSENRLYPTA